MDVKELAAVALDNMERKQREDGSKFWTLKDDAPDWMEELCHEAHGDMLPDDWRYEFIEKALEIIQDGGDEDELEADIYNSDLLNWLASRNSRQNYVDDAVDEWGYPGSIMEAIQYGQLKEKREVYGVVLGFLKEKAEEEEEEEN